MHSRCPNNYAIVCTYPYINIYYTDVLINTRMAIHLLMLTYGDNYNKNKSGSHHNTVLSVFTEINIKMLEVVKLLNCVVVKWQTLFVFYLTHTKCICHRMKLL